MSGMSWSVVWLWHNGYYRHSMGPAGKLTSKPDIDLWYEPTYGNYFKLLHALAAIGVDVSEYQNEVSPDPRRPRPAKTSSRW